MNFNASGNEKSVFPANAEANARFKGAPAVLPPPQTFGMGMGQLPPAPMGLGFGSGYSKQSDLDSPFSFKTEPKMRDEHTAIRPFVETTNGNQFPVFNGEPKQSFGLISELEPFMLLSKLERVLEFGSGIDHYRSDEQNVIRGRYFGELNNAEFEIRVFTWSGSEGNSYAEFNRFCGDGWAFTLFVEQTLSKFGGNPPQQPPQLPVLALEYGQGDFAAMLADVEESYQDIAEQSAAELAAQTRKESVRQMCDGIEAFCPRVLHILETSNNCAIVRSMLICLTNMSEFNGLTKRILGQQGQAVRNVGNKWSATQQMCGGLFQIPPSQEVQRIADGLLMMC